MPLLKRCNRPSFTSFQQIILMLDIFPSLNIVLMLFYTSFNCYALSLNFVQESAADDDDDLDLFGDETEDEKKAAEQREAAKASTKKKESEFNITVIV